MSIFLTLKPGTARRYQQLMIGRVADGTLVRRGALGPTVDVLPDRRRPGE
jgi:hypothetical protein